MVEDHVLAVCYAGAVLALWPYMAHAPAEVAADEIVRTGKRAAVSVYGDPLARGGLSGNIEVLSEDYRTLGYDDSRDIEDDNRA